jgi:hypothetical protein
LSELLPIHVNLADGTIVVSMDDDRRSASVIVLELRELLIDDGMQVYRFNVRRARPRKARKRRDDFDQSVRAALDDVEKLSVILTELRIAAQSLNAGAQGANDIAQLVSERVIDGFDGIQPRLA